MGFKLLSLKACQGHKNDNAGINHSLERLTNILPWISISFEKQDFMAASKTKLANASTSVDIKHPVLLFFSMSLKLKCNWKAWKIGVHAQEVDSKLTLLKELCIWISKNITPKSSLCNIKNFVLTNDNNAGVQKM